MPSSTDENTQKRLVEVLERITKKAVSLAKCVEDIDEKSHSDIEVSLSMLEKTFNMALKNQKKSGKKFLSHELIDDTISNLLKNSTKFSESKEDDKNKELK